MKFLSISITIISYLTKEAQKSWRDIYERVWFAYTSSIEWSIKHALITSKWNGLVRVRVEGA